MKALLSWVIRIVFIALALIVLYWYFGGIWRLLGAVGLYFLGTIAGPERLWAWVIAIGKAIGKLVGIVHD